MQNELRSSASAPETLGVVAAPPLGIGLARPLVAKSDDRQSQALAGVKVSKDDIILKPRKEGSPHLLFSSDTSSVWNLKRGHARSSTVHPPSRNLADHVPKWNRFEPLCDSAPRDPPVRPHVDKVALEKEWDSLKKQKRREVEFKRGKIVKHQGQRLSQTYASAATVALLPQRPEQVAKCVTENTNAQNLPRSDVSTRLPVFHEEEIQFPVFHDEPVSWPIYEGPMEREVDPPILPVANLENRKIRRRLVPYFIPSISTLPILALYNDRLLLENNEFYAKQKRCIEAHLTDSEVMLPEGLVDELGAYWANKPHSSKEYMVSFIVCSQKTKVMILTPEQEAVANIYAPLAAALKYFPLTGDSHKVMSQDYYSSYALFKTFERAQNFVMNLSGFVQWLLLFFLFVACSGFVVACYWLGWLITFLSVNSEVILTLLNRVISGTVVRMSLFTHNLHYAPFYEELIKRVPYVGWLFPWVEFCVYMRRFRKDPGMFPNVPVYAFIIARLLCVWLHYVFAGAPFVLGVLMHMLNNMLAETGLHPVDFLVWPAYRSNVVMAISEVKKQPLVNVIVPKPSGDNEMRAGAKMRLCGELRGNLRLKAPDECRGHQFLFFGDSGQYGPNGYASNQVNEEQAVYHRVVKQTTPPDIDRLRELFAWVKEPENFRELFGKRVKVHSFIPDAYLKGSNASPSVKRILTKTFETLRQAGYDEESILTRSERYSWTTRSSFVKVENNLYCSPAGIKLKAPRMIQGARPEFICLVGPWIAAFQQLIKRRWGLQNFMTFTSGLSPLNCARKIDVPGWRIVEDDLAAYDSSICKEWCEFEVWLCKQFGAPRAVLDLMEANISTHGYTHHGWQYSVQGTRKSGDPYTSLMNSIINGLAHLFIYCTLTGRSVAEARHHIAMILQGDDNALAHSDNCEFPWAKEMARLGFESKAIYRESMYTVEFCSNRLYETNKGWVFGPKPGKVLAKLGYVINPPEGVSRESMMRGIALGLRKQCSFIPPIMCVLDRVLELTEGHEAYFERKRWENFDVVGKPGFELLQATPSVWYGLHEQYGWNSSMQLWLETFMSTFQFGDSLDQTYLNVLFDRDTSADKLIFGA